MHVLIPQHQVDRSSRIQVKVIRADMDGDATCLHAIFVVGQGSSILATFFIVHSDEDETFGILGCDKHHVNDV